VIFFSLGPHQQQWDDIFSVTFVFECGDYSMYIYEIIQHFKRINTSGVLIGIFYQMQFAQ